MENVPYTIPLSLQFAPHSPFHLTLCSPTVFPCPYNVFQQPLVNQDCECVSKQERHAKIGEITKQLKKSLPRKVMDFSGAYIHIQTEKLVIFPNYVENLIHKVLCVQIVVHIIKLTIPFLFLCL